MENEFENSQVSRQIDWINCAKFLAILAVLIDHTNRVLYYNQHIALASYYSVSLFILISGYLSFGSNIRHNRSYGGTVIKSCKKITLAYLLASLIYCLLACHVFDFQTYLNAIIHFNASSPFYYVLLYIQLMIANKAIYQLLVYSKRYKKVYEIIYDIVLGAIIFFISSVTTNYTNIFDIYGGGGKVLGGTYLLLFYFGMVFNKYKIFVNNSRIKIVLIFATSVVGYFCWWRLMCNGFKSAIDSKECVKKTL